MGVNRMNVSYFISFIKKKNKKLTARSFHQQYLDQHRWSLWIPWI